MRIASQNDSFWNNEGTNTFFQTDILNSLNRNSCEKAQNKPGNLTSKRPSFYVQVLKDLRFFQSAPYISLRFILQIRITVVTAPFAAAAPQHCRRRHLSLPSADNADWDTKDVRDLVLYDFLLLANIPLICSFLQRKKNWLANC